LDAFELREGQPAGYQFQVVGNPEDDLLALLGRLIEKMRRALALRHIEDSTLGYKSPILRPSLTGSTGGNRPRVYPRRR